MAFDVFSTQALSRVVTDLNVPAYHLTGTYFMEEEFHSTEEIWFDVEKNPPRIMAFVHPDVPAGATDQTGYETKSFKPAYAKDLRTFKGNAPLKRQPGEPFGGGMSPAGRIQALVARALADQRMMLNQRMEVMVSEALRLGQITVVGENYPLTVVNFSRDPALTVALAGAARWSETTATPVDDIENWAELVLQLSGAVVTRIDMAPDAWKALRAHQDVKDLLETRRGSSSAAETGPIARGQGAAKARYVGTLGTFDLYTYQDSYFDPADDPETDTARNVMPSGQVIMAASDGNLMGVQAFGAIQDDDAGYAAQGFFAKSWVPKNPGRRVILAQSAPLPVMYRPNASLGATVL